MASILVVDDLASCRKLFAEILNSEGHAVITAVDGLEGLTRFYETLPDIVVTDLAMPKMNGFKLIAAIRHDYPDQRIIVVTGERYDYKELERAKVLVAHKPLMADQLLALVDQLH